MPHSVTNEIVGVCSHYISWRDVATAITSATIVSESALESQSYNQQSEEYKFHVFRFEVKLKLKALQRNITFCLYRLKLTEIGNDTEWNFLYMWNILISYAKLYFYDIFKYF